MEALVCTGLETMEIADVSAPSGDGVRIRVHACGICGSDMHAYRGHDPRRPVPIVLGHEAAGLTEDGRRVTINPLITCGRCPACERGETNICPNREILSMPPRPGAFAPWVNVAPQNLVAVPDDMAFEVAALAEPLACGWHAMRLAQNTLGEFDDTVTALVLGGGAIGVGAALALRAAGAGKVLVVEPNDLRRERLDAITGFTAVAAAPDHGARIVIDAVGLVATRATASALAAPGGVIVHIGLGEDTGGLDIRRMTLQDIAFRGSYTYTAQDFRDTVAAMIAGDLGGLDWVETRPLADGPQAFSDILAGRVAAPKISLIPDHKE